MPQPTTPSPPISPLPPEMPGWLKFLIDNPLTRLFANFQRDPIGTITRSATAAMDALEQFADRYGSLLLAVALILVAVRVLVAVVQEYRRTRGACWVEIHCPPEATMHGAT